MLINNLSLKNFKCFEEVDVEFAPITLLTGANSSGKSSLIYSLLAVLQTEQFPFYLSPNGKYVNLGGFEEIAFNHKSQTFSINIQMVDQDKRIFPEYKVKSIWKQDISSDLPTLMHLEFVSYGVSIEMVNESMESPSFNLNIRLKLEDPEKPFSKKFIDSYQRTDLKKYTTVKNDIFYLKNVPLDSIKELFSKIMRRNDTELFGILPNWDHDWEYTNLSFNYIGSFRQPPERTYYQKAKAQSKVDTDGAGYIDQIIEWEETDPDKLAELAKIMSDLELFKEIKSNKFRGGRFELAVKTQTNSELAALTDVGFGISQFLPIIVADLQLDDQSCLALSQPEIHLHPKIQALFGNFLANQIKHTQKQYIVETHSEYLLNRIRLLLVKGELKPEDVRVYYFENDGIKTTTHKVEFATDGQIKGAPQGFFDTYAIDIMDIAMNSFAD